MKTVLTLKQRAKAAWLILTSTPVEVDIQMQGYEAKNAVVDVVTERARHIELGYDAAHDDKMGPAHLMREGHWRLGHMGEVSSPEAARHGLIVVASLMVAAVESLDRTQAKIEGTPKLKGYL